MAPAVDMLKFKPDESASPITVEIDGEVRDD